MRKCQITHKKTKTGNYISKSKRKTKRKFYPNLQKHKIWSIKTKKFIKLLICKKALTLITKKGLDTIINL